ncbi:16149_t:CDS:1, partial [Entrophospora sp. SA101]
GYSSFSAPPGYNVIEVYPFNNPLRITFWTPSESIKTLLSRIPLQNRSWGVAASRSLPGQA